MLVTKVTQFESEPSVTWESIRRFLKESSPEFSDFIHLFASPQIKNVGTLVGNVANASPIADSIGYLMMMEATDASCWSEWFERCAHR